MPGRWARVSAPAWSRGMQAPGPREAALLAPAGAEEGKACRPRTCQPRLREGRSIYLLRKETQLSIR